jgi:uncharacterized protein YwgA
MSSLDWLMLFAAYEGTIEEAQPQLDRLALHKGLFLLTKTTDLPESEVYAFLPGPYGPYSPDLARDLDLLVWDGSLSEKVVEGARYAVHIPSDEMRQKANELSQRPGVSDYLLYIEVIRTLLSNLSFRDIVSGIYAAYPDYTKATVVPEYLPDGERGARGHLAHVFLPKEIRFSVGAWRGIQELERGEGVGFSGRR